MENIFIIIVILLLCTRSNDLELLCLIAIGANIALFISLFNLDIAIYYALNAVLAMSLAYFAAYKIETQSAKVYASIMVIQGCVCLTLVANWTHITNELLQYTLSVYNNMIHLIIISVGIAGSDNFFSRIYYRYDRSYNQRCCRSSGDNKADWRKI